MFSPSERQYHSAVTARVGLDPNPGVAVTVSELLHPSGVSLLKWTAEGFRPKGSMRVERVRAREVLGLVHTEWQLFLFAI